ncbi:hypothetical protein ACHQM5_011940 [Ranunculus cassubicifolius]
MESPNPSQLKPVPIHYITTLNSPEFTLLSHSLTHSTIIALDAEWKPIRTHPYTFPTVSLLQLACRVHNSSTELIVFLVDLMEIELIRPIWEILKEMFVRDGVLKLGFKFKQDLVFLSSTFCGHGCQPGFDKVEPYIDIANVYHYLQHKKSRKKLPKNNKSLAAICEEILGVSLSKELQCSDWSCRPLTEEQKAYAAADAQCLVEIFDFFQDNILKEGISSHSNKEFQPSNGVLGLKEILETSDDSDNILNRTYFQASDIIRSTTISEIRYTTSSLEESFSSILSVNNFSVDPSLSKLVGLYSEKLMLKESDRSPKPSKKKKKRHLSDKLRDKEAHINSNDYSGPYPWDSSLGGDGYPKFLCDVMVEGLAKHLRNVGIDAAVPFSRIGIDTAVPHPRKPDPRILIDKASKEKRILLTRDAKLLKHDYIIPNQVYFVQSLLKNDQLVEVIEKFNLQISEDQIMSRCTKCNGQFIQKPLSTEEAIEAGKGFQVIPNCLFNKSLEFWQCIDCKQLYWEGTQYKNALQKFIDICKINK